jgi:hypothetical protein
MLKIPAKSHVGPATKVNKKYYLKCGVIFLTKDIT